MIIRARKAGAVNKEPMTMQEDKAKNIETAELHEHYDFDYSAAKPNRFATRLSQEQLMVVIDPELAAIFPTSEAVNEALRVLAMAAQNLPHTTPKRPGSHVKQRLFLVDKQEVTTGTYRGDRRMMADPQPLTEVTQEALRLLYRELGVVNTIRFLNQFTTGFGNYTEERRAWLENQTLDEVLADLRAYQTGRQPRQQDLRPQTATGAEQG